MIEYQTFADFVDTVEPLVAPEDLGSELVDFFRDQVGNALADLQTLIPWLRGFNVNFVDKGGVDEFCNASVFNGPVGKIVQVFAFKPGLDCKKFHYRRVSTAALECWLDRQRCLCPATTPASSSIYDSPYCNYVISGENACGLPYLTATEDDCRFKSLDPSERIFAVGPDYKMYAAPRFPCGYVLLVQWQGIRRKWEDSDSVPVDQQVREAVVNYVEHKMALKERNSVAMQEYFNAYTVNLRTLNYRYIDEHETGPHKDCTAGIETLMPAFQALYSTALAGDGSGTGGTDNRVLQVFVNRAPAAPDDPNIAALSFPTGGGPLQQWDPLTQSWN